MSQRPAEDLETALVDKYALRTSELRYMVQLKAHNSQHVRDRFLRRTLHGLTILLHQLMVHVPGWWVIGREGVTVCVPPEAHFPAWPRNGG